MTTPEERRRNLRWGRELLEELAHDPGLQEDWRQTAIALLAGYPAASFVDQFDAADLDELAPHAGALLQVRMLFTRVLACDDCSDQRRYSLRVVLRHFP